MELKKQKELLRELAQEIAEISVLPIQKKTLADWKNLNGLKPRRPMFMIDQLPWGQLNHQDELTLICEEPLLRGFEWQLRESLYRWKHMQDDRVVIAELRVPKAISNTGFGVSIKEDIIHGEPGTAAHSHDYQSVLKNEDDLEKIKFAQISENKEQSIHMLQMAQEIFDGILNIRQGGVDTYGHAWDMISMWHGVEESMLDIIERPEFIHKILEKTFAVMHDAMDQYEKFGLIDVGQPFIHCTGAYTDELPGFSNESQEKIQSSRNSTKNVWTYGAAQLFSMVSPDMHDQFEIAYQQKWFARFGLGYYGCCEPLDRKIDVIRKLPNVRKISMSPWTDMNLGAEAMGGDYVFSRKPNPAFLASDIAWNAELVRQDLTEACKISAKYNNPCELILKDVSTVGNKPQRLWEWAKIGAEVCGRGD